MQARLLCNSAYRKQCSQRETPVDAQQKAALPAACSSLQKSRLAHHCPHVHHPAPSRCVPASAAHGAAQSRAVGATSLPGLSTVSPQRNDQIMISQETLAKAAEIIQTFRVYLWGESPPF